MTESDPLLTSNQIVELLDEEIENNETVLSLLGNASQVKVVEKKKVKN